MKSVIKEKKAIKKFEFTEEIWTIVKESVYNNWTREKTAKSLGIPESTWKYNLANNIANVSVKVRSWEIDRMLRKAERVSDEILDADSNNGGKKLDPNILAIKQREAAFLREKLRKAGEDYETRTQQVNVVVAPVPILGGLFEQKEIDIDSVDIK